MCSHIVGITFPGYGSFRALETYDPTDEKQWLTYWIVFALMETFETFGGWILEWIPLFYELKLLFIIWLISPATRGAEVLYNEVIWKLLHEYASKLDPTFYSDSKTPPKLDKEVIEQSRRIMKEQGPGAFDALLQHGDKFKSFLGGVSQ